MTNTTTTTTAKFTKASIKALAWPKGATHVKLTTPNGKWTVVEKRSAVASLDGTEGTLTFGAMIKSSPKDKTGTFTPIVAPTVTPDAIKVPDEPKTEKAPSEKKVKTEKAPKGPSSATKLDVEIMRLIHGGKTGEAVEAAKAAGLEDRKAAKRVARVARWYKRAKLAGILS